MDLLGKAMRSVLWSGLHNAVLILEISHYAFKDKIFKVLLGKSQAANNKISFHEMNRWIHTESNSITFISFWSGTHKDWFEKKSNSEGGRAGGKSHTISKMVQLLRCQDAS